MNCFSGNILNSHRSNPCSIKRSEMYDKTNLVGGKGQTQFFWRPKDLNLCERLWLSGKESACQSRRCRFDSPVGEIPWSRKLQPTPVFLPGRFHRQRSLVGYSPRSRKRVKCDLGTKQQQQFKRY